VKSEVSGELTLKVGTEVVIREEGRRSISGNIRVLEDRSEKFSCEGALTVMKRRDVSVRAQAGGWTSPKRSRSCSQCRVLDLVEKVQLSERDEAINW